MYYFGINLDSRFSVPDFWPKKGQTHQIPFEQDEIKAELDRLRQRRLAARAKRLAMEEQGLAPTEVHTAQDRVNSEAPREYLSSTKVVRKETEGSEGGEKKGGWFGWAK